MIAEGVDPRDIIWEADDPVYRVYFWHQPPAPEGIPQEQVMFHCDEWRLSGAGDVHEVLAWAEQHKGARSYTLYAEHDEDRGGAFARGLIRLAGTDPTEDSSESVTIRISLDSDV